MASKEWQVTKEESGIKLVHFLQRKLGDDYSAKALKRELEANACQINGRMEHFASKLVGTGDLVRFQCRSVKKKKMEVPHILFEDEDFVFIDKPAGISSEDPHLLTVLQNDGKRSTLFLAHRLDKDTTGVLVLAKSLRAKKELFLLFKERKIAKSYFALVDGVPPKNQGRIENHLGPISSYHGQTLWGAVSKEKGSVAITEWELLKRGNVCALLKCFPLTGRTHQIRVHLAAMGHPILGDKQYGKAFRSSLRPGRCLLHAGSLSFVHPFTHHPLSVESPLPPDFLI